MIVPETPGMPDAPFCLVLPHARLDGPTNMARDEAMLESASVPSGTALFRTYEWSEPTLSLGYFQAISEVEADPRWRGVAVVRRATGGGAILHDREVTFSLAVPGSHPLARRSGPLYQALHDAVARTLRDRGVAATRRGEPTGPAGDRSRPFLCFQDLDPEDLVVGPWKVVGSAQRRRSGAVLQHGSVSLERSDLTPELPGVSDLARAGARATDWPTVLRAEIPERLGFLVEPIEWPENLLDRSHALFLEVYSQQRWTRRR